MMCRQCRASVNNEVLIFVEIDASTSLRLSTRLPPQAIRQRILASGTQCRYGEQASVAATVRQVAVAMLQADARQQFFDAMPPALGFGAWQLSLDVNDALSLIRH
jgi:hypothetical protein